MGLLNSAKPRFFAIANRGFERLHNPFSSLAQPRPPKFSLIRTKILLVVDELGAKASNHPNNWRIGSASTNLTGRSPGPGIIVVSRLIPIP